MTLNLRKQVFQKTNATQAKSQFLQKNKITINEPKQTHFSVEGVQAYSPEEIAALKNRQERVKAKLQGQYIQPKCYKIDDQIEFDRPSTANEQMRVTMKPKKNKKVQLQQAKPQAKVKPSIKNELGRANQKLVKKDKNLQQKEKYEKRLDQLKQEYKKHFGDTIKNKDKPKQQQPDNQQPIQHDQSFKVEQQQGEQCLPTQLNKNKQKSLKTIAKTKKDVDDSFQEVQWQEKALSIRSSKLNKSQNANTYSQKLGNAVYFLFD